MWSPPVSRLMTYFYSQLTDLVKDTWNVPCSKWMICRIYGQSLCLSASFHTKQEMYTHTHARTEKPDPKAIFKQGSRVCPHYRLWVCSHHSVTALAARMGFSPLFSSDSSPLFHLNFSCISLHLFLRQKIIISQERQFPAPMVPYTLPVKSFWKPYIFGKIFNNVIVS